MTEVSPNSATPLDCTTTATTTSANNDSGGEVVIKSHKFRVGHRYQCLNLIGEGAYGTVISAIDKTSGIKVAIKKISPFKHLLFCQRTLREIKILALLSHENIIGILDILCDSKLQNLNDIYLIQPYMHTDLNKVLQKIKLSIEHIRYFLYQIFRGIKYIHSANILHRDLKPSNILVNENCDLKICDFGLARLVDPCRRDNTLTEYVTTRWYRAPEVMLNPKGYTKSLDIWSVGCILAEMINNRPLFPGKQYIDQLNIILEIRGSPTDADLKFIQIETTRKYVKNLPHRPKKPWNQVFEAIDDDLMEMLDLTLAFSPENRISAESGLSHRFVAQYHDPTDEARFQPEITNSCCIQEFDDSTPIEKLKELILQEAVDFHHSTV